MAFSAFFRGVDGFDNSLTVSNIYGLVNAEWQESYKGATGVVSGKYDDDWIGVQVRLNTTAAKLAAMDWDYVEIKVTIDFSTGTRTSWDGIYSNTAGWTYTTDGDWRIYKATKEGIITQFGSLDNFYTAITTGGTNNDDSRLFTLWNMKSHGTFYFDYFKLGKN